MPIDMQDDFDFLNYTPKFKNEEKELANTNLLEIFSI